MKSSKTKPKSWFKWRGYPHLTRRINIEDCKKWFFKYANTPKAIAKHAFMPLLYKTIVQRRYKKTKNEFGIQLRSHCKFDKHKNKWIKNAKKRPIHFATHCDAHIYSRYSNLLANNYERNLKQNLEFSACITAYRKLETPEGLGKNNIHFAKEVFDFIKNKGECVALAFDIESFFNSLDHKLLKKAWAGILNCDTLPKDHYNIFKSVTNFSYINLQDLRLPNGGFDEKRLAQNRRNGVHAFFLNSNELRKDIDSGKLNVYKNQYQDKSNKGQIRGIPQGLPISSILANLYLLRFDKMLFQKVMVENGGLYRRYSDDIIVVCNIRSVNEIKTFIESEIKKFKLEIAISKTDQAIFKLKPNMIGEKRLFSDKPITYLGWTFDGTSVRIKSASLSKFHRRMKSACKTAVRHAQKFHKKTLSSQSVIYKRRLRLLFTEYGIKPRIKVIKQLNYNFNNVTGLYYAQVATVKRKNRGNYLSNVRKALLTFKENESKSIKKQVRNTSKIFEKYLKHQMQIVSTI